MRYPLPTEEGDTLAYVGYLSLEGRIAPESLPQYLSDVSHYHELHHLKSTMKMPLVRAVRAYRRQHDVLFRAANVRTGFRAFTMRGVVVQSSCITELYDMRCCAAVTFAFIFQRQSVTVNAITKADV